LFGKFFIVLLLFINFLLNLNANEKQLIINQLIDINNITFDFEQLTNQKKEVGTCILVFDNKLRCNYQDSMRKEIVVNGKTLIVKKKRYDKIYFYPISNSPFMKILNKDGLLNLIKKSNYALNNKIELTYTDNNNKIIIFFDKENHNIVGWQVDDQLQNKINFSLKIKSINSVFDPKIFLIPPPY